MRQHFRWTSGFIREQTKTYGVLCCAEHNLLTNNPCEKSAVMSLRHILRGEIKGDAPIYGKFAIVYYQCLNQVSGLTWWANARH